MHYPFYNSDNIAPSLLVHHGPIRVSFHWRRYTWTGKPTFWEKRDLSSTNGESKKTVNDVVIGGILSCFAYTLRLKHAYNCETRTFHLVRFGLRNSRCLHSTFPRCFGMSKRLSLRSTIYREHHICTDLFPQPGQMRVTRCSKHLNLSLKLRIL
jgi:hypothetical protein